MKLFVWVNVVLGVVNVAVFFIGSHQPINLFAAAVAAMAASSLALQK